MFSQCLILVFSRGEIHGFLVCKIYILCIHSVYNMLQYKNKNKDSKMENNLTLSQCLKTAQTFFDELGWDMVVTDESCKELCVSLNKATELLAFFATTRDYELDLEEGWVAFQGRIKFYFIEKQAYIENTDLEKLKINLL